MPKRRNIPQNVASGSRVQAETDIGNAQNAGAKNARAENTGMENTERDSSEYGKPVFFFAQLTFTVTSVP